MQIDRETPTIRASMTDATGSDSASEAKPAKKGFMGLVFGLVGALALGGGAFYAIYAGLLDFGGDEPHAATTIMGDVAFVPMQPILISLPPGSSARHLRFQGQLEVAPLDVPAVEQLMPRILDVLNTYLRAVEVRDLEQPSSIARLRAQMLRRIQVVAGENAVRDLLIIEFILN